MTDIVDAHYRRLSTRYDEFLLYSPDFVGALTSKMIEMLELQPDEVIVDLGCGTGIYSNDILRQVPLKTEVVGVDPSSGPRSSAAGAGTPIRTSSRR